MLKLLALTLFMSTPARGWWCEGHQIVALIAEKHLTPTALAAVTKLLKENRPGVLSSCKTSTQSLMAIASTWADDVKRSEKTGPWHYMDIPLGVKKGDPEAYCEPIGPSVNGGDRPGCILSALRYAVNVLHSEKETPTEKATALRYLIHLVGDLHQPLHTTTNNDQGGNCTPVAFLEEPKTANLHSVWDGMIVNQVLAQAKESSAQLAEEIDTRFEDKRGGWTKNSPAFDKWAWEGHMLARNIVYSKLNPVPPIQEISPKLVCKVELEQLGTLNIKINTSYETVAAPVIQEQLAKAGYRLAEIINLILG